MGNISSRPGDESAAVYLRDQNRFSPTALSITNSRNRTLFNITPNSFPATRCSVRREAGDNTAIEYVQDPDSSSSPSFLLRLSNDDELTFNFTFVIRQTTGAMPSDTAIVGLTYMFGPSMKDLENLATREFHADPNLHKNPNVELVGDCSTSGKASVQFNWSWKWKPPKQLEDRGWGWRTCCSFVEYNQRAHRLDTLASFSLWVQNTQRMLGSPATSPRFELPLPPRSRLPSAQSIDSRVSGVSGVSDSDATDPTANQPSSPPFEATTESGIGLAPTQTASTVAAPIKVDVACQRPGEDVSAVDDSPLFRATIKAMEQRTATMKMRWKKVLKAAEAAQEAQTSCNDAVNQLTLALKDASSSNANAVQPAIENYFGTIAREILAYEKQNTINIQKMIIDPIAKLYNSDIKQAEAKKKDFDEESREYYAYVGRYLGQRTEGLKEKKKTETDNKYQYKRRNFELKRFDYSSFMQDLHGGRKDQEVLSQLTKYADAQARGFLNTAKKIESMMPQLDALTSEVKEADKEFRLQRTGREEKRRVLELSTMTYVEPTSALAMQPSTPGHARATETETTPRSTSIVPTFKITSSVSGQASTGSTSGVPMRQDKANSPSAVVLGPSPNDKFRGIRDLEEKNHSNSAPTDTSGEPLRKEGLLWALSRPGSHVDPKGLNKQAWHKFWIVVDQGKLTEYQNWKQRLELHRDPIDLRVASVREARNAERRFCFEVITPQFTRIYQATSADDMKSWISSVNIALQSAVEGKNGPERFSTDSLPGQTRLDFAAVLTGKSSSMSGHHSHIKPSAGKFPTRHATVGDRPSQRTDRSSETGAHLLKQIREADVGNTTCADCGSADKVDWVSINLGIIICIECSGIHRSLGTHISKVRSITLDSTAFTADVVEVLLIIGNRVSNIVWEAKLNRAEKPLPTATREQRLHFITRKYADRAFVQPISSTLSHFSNAEETLLASIKKNDIQNVLYALALKANPNATDRSRGTHAVFLALAAADPADPSGSASLMGTGSPAPIPPARSPSSSSTFQAQPPTGARKPFPVAELLLLNNADLPAQPAPIPLSAAAKLYLEQKADQKSGRRGIGAPSGQAAGGKMDGVADSSGDALGALPGTGGGVGAGVARSGTLGEREAKLLKRVSAGGRLVKAYGGTGG